MLAEGLSNHPASAHGEDVLGALRVLAMHAQERGAPVVITLPYVGEEIQIKGCWDCHEAVARRLNADPVSP